MRLVSYSPYSPRFRGAFAGNPFDSRPAFRLLDSLLADRAAPAADYGYEEVEENRYRLTLNVAGFDESELTVESRGDLLVVEGKSEDGKRAVDRSFRLGEMLEVVGARLEKGLLAIDIERVVPEALKPRRIEIEGAGAKSLARKAKKLIGGEKKAA